MNSKENEQHLHRQREAVTYRIKKLKAKQEEITEKTNAMKEKIKKKYEDMKRVLDEDLRVTLNQLDLERTATNRLVEEKMEECKRLAHDLDRKVDQTARVAKSEQEVGAEESDRGKRISGTLTSTDPDLIQVDAFKNEQLLSLTVNLLLFIRSQLPVAKRLFRSYVADVALDANTAHPKLLISPKGDSATYTDTWQDLPETPSRFDNTLNVMSQQGFSEGRQYWEVDVSGKTYWELGLTYASIPRSGRQEDCWLGRGKESWCVEYFQGDYNAWHDGVQLELPLLRGKEFTRIGVYCSFPGGLLCFLGADAMTPIYCFCAGTFTDPLHLALCPGHDNEGTNWPPMRICDASRSAPVLRGGGIVLKD